MSSTERSPSPPLTNRTAEVRRDAIFDRWVLISPARARRPSDFKSHSPASGTPNPKPSCAFCAGREGECAPEIFRVPPSSSADWKIRVIENLYPALRRDAEPPDPSDGVAAAGTGRCAVTGFGFHDVVIETPDHSVHLPDLSPEEVGEVLLAYKQRILQLACLGSIKYVQVFKNYGASAGASMAHSHSQIMGLPLVPPLASSRLDSTKKFYDMTGKCSLCEVRSEDILVCDTVHYFAIVPFAASYPFEVWIVPRDHTAHFHEIDHEKILPHLNVIGGFEIGTGCFINPVFPEDAAKVLREVDCSK
ncbi:hypothetical protein GW17_00042041 [Ensete ventricosum]|nr:hypothetical protein GW17_00042041 [Ensete ventricosum]